MKKIFLLLIGVSALAQIVFCQNKFGLKAGLNLANQSKTSTVPQNPTSQKGETKPLLGYQFGIFYKAKLKSHWTISAEANFSLAGSQTQYLTEQQILNPDGITHYYNDKIGYIEVPFSVQY